jgi:hypothetical protein
MKIKKVLILGLIGLALFVAAAAAAIYRANHATPPGFELLAPNASEAPKHTAGKPSDQPKVQWPSDFQPPLDVKIDVPAVPDEVQPLAAEKAKK